MDMPTQDLQDWLESMGGEAKEEAAKTLTQRMQEKEMKAEIEDKQPFPLKEGELGLAKLKSYFNGEILT